MSRIEDWKGKAKAAATSLRREYEAGKSGDDSPVEPIAPTARDYLDKVVAAMGLSKSAPADDDAEDAATEEVAEALRGVDWAKVRAATSDKASDASKAMRSMADQVDWDKVKPVAGAVSSALIAAVASGQLRVIGGPLAPTVARAIVNQGNLAQRVGEHLGPQREAAAPDFRGAIEVSSREV